MEPERKIEKLLRAFATKRRAEAGEPLKLHPATRRLLQAEAARAAPKSDAEDSSLSLWQLFRQQWAVLIGFALVVFLGATLFLPALSSAKRKAQRITAVNNLKQIGLAAQMAANENDGKLPASLDALTNGFVAATVLTDPASGKPFIYVAGGENLDTLPGNAVLAYSPDDENRRAVLFADGRVELADRAQFSELTNQKSFQLAMSKNVARGPVKQMPAIVSGEASQVAPAVAAASAPVEAVKKPEESQSADLGAIAGNLHEPAAPKPEVAGAEPQVVEPSTPTAATAETLAPAVTATNLTAGAAFGSAATPPPATAPVMALNDRVAKTQGLFYRNIAAQTNSAQITLNGANLPPRLRREEAQTYSNSAGASVPAAAPVLAHFQLQQNGDAIRIVDQDGSVYTGSLVPAAVASQSARLQPEGIPSAQSAGLRPGASGGGGAANVSLQPEVKNVLFRVAGTNRTLDQTIVFDGSLIMMINAPTNATQPAAVGGGTAGQFEPGAVPRRERLLSISRIEGAAVIGHTNRIEVNAVPAVP
jgi:type II secretory pathway pseudopilin PulG